jgi:bifunctional oligoribonuclease and PAP phosphatase NrnA
VTMPSAERPKFHAFVQRHSKLLLTTHVNPDGDGLGSEVAAALWLEALGKQVRILNDSSLPPAFGFLVDMHPIEEFTPDGADRAMADSDALIVLDTSNRQRIGRLSPMLDQHILPIAVVDHHVSHAEGFGQVNVIEPEASATGEIVYDMVRETGAEVTREMAEALYVALITDTGSFRYSNTDSHAHRMAAELLLHGLDPPKIHAQVSSHATPGRLRFFGEVLTALQVIEDGRIVVMEATPEQFQRHGLTGSDTEGLVDMPRTIAGVDVVALFSEVEPGKVKVSLRSNGRVAIDSVVTRLGGGGHPHAAGVMLRSSRAEARERVLPELGRLVGARVVTGAGGSA